MTTTRPQRSVGRPRSTAASAHEAIIDAVYDLLQARSVRDLTMEEIAKHAGVGKPTLYKWWSSKAALVLTMLRERITPALDAPEARSLEESVQIKVERLIAAFDGFFGKVIAELIAEGQSEPAVLRELNRGYIDLRRADTVADVRRAQAAGEFPADLDGELLVDAVFGAIYYQLLLKQRPLTRDYGRALVGAMFRNARSRLPADGSDRSGQP